MFLYEGVIYHSLNEVEEVIFEKVGRYSDNVEYVEEQTAEIVADQVKEITRDDLIDWYHTQYASTFKEKDLPTDKLLKLYAEVNQYFINRKG